MKFLKSHFALSQRQQNGIFVLVILIILFQVVIFFMNSSEDETDYENDEQVEYFRRQLDSLNKVNPKGKDTIYPFNPNFITDFKGYQLGLSPEQIDRLLAYRQTDKWVNSAEEFQKVTGVSDSLLKIISVHFRFPEWTQKEQITKVVFQKLKNSPIVIADLNSATAEDLKTVNGVGDVLSVRIVKYRLSIGGFVAPIQLNDVYGLSPEVIQNILRSFQIISKPEIDKKNINSIGISELADLPYIDYDLAQKIITYRKLNEGIRSFEELSKINGFPSDKIDRIKLYLALE